MLFRLDRHQNSNKARFAPKEYSSGIIPFQAHLRAKYAVAGRFLVRRQVEIVFACKFSNYRLPVRAQRRATGRRAASALCSPWRWCQTFHAVATVNADTAGPAPPGFPLTRHFPRDLSVCSSGWPGDARGDRLCWSHWLPSPSHMPLRPGAGQPRPGADASARRPRVTPTLA